jgi:hypothetical protein
VTDSENPAPHARPGSDTPPVNGDEVRDTWFLRSSIWRSYGGGFIGYAASEVDASRLSLERQSRLSIDLARTQSGAPRWRGGARAAGRRASRA